MAGNGCRSSLSFWLDSACWELALRRWLPLQAIYIPLTNPTPKGQLLLPVQYGCCLDLVPYHVISSCLPCCDRACISSTSIHKSHMQNGLHLNSAVRLQRSMNSLIVHNHSVAHTSFVAFSICSRLTLSCRTYELAGGAALVCFSFVPTFRHFRMLNVIGLIGTTFTEW